jgi:hypothetical protein
MVAAGGASAAPPPELDGLEPDGVDPEAFVGAVPRIVPPPDDTYVRRVPDGELPVPVTEEGALDSMGLVPPDIAIDRGIVSSGAVGSDEAAPIQCNYRVCSRFYRSFRPSDCTYQPYRGPRRLCTR